MGCLPRNVPCLRGESSRLIQFAVAFPFTKHIVHTIYSASYGSMQKGIEIDNIDASANTAGQGACDR
jgi:hypothetical protein